jgi:FkbM family methyltransferase
MRQSITNRWLDSSIKAYVDNYGQNPRPVIYEVGSRDGDDGHELAQRIGGITPVIVLFEANPPSQKAIEEKYPEAILIKEAISDVAGEVEFLQIHGDKNMVGSSTMNTKRDDSWIKETSTIKVKTRRLDDVIKELDHQDTDIDIMKIDIEGYTAEALRSLGKYLRNVRVFHLETEIEGAARAETNLDIALYMESKGYKCSAIDYEWPPNIEDQVWVRIDG